MTGINQDLVVEIIWYSLDKTDKKVNSGEVMTNSMLACEREVEKSERCKFFSFFGHEIPCELSEEELYEKMPMLLGDLTDKIRKKEDLNGI